MKKSLNKYSRIIWGLVAAYLFLDAAYFVTSRFHLDVIPQDFGLELVRSTIFAVVQMGGLAVLIEVVDQIRWNALSPDQRN